MTEQEWLATLKPGSTVVLVDEQGRRPRLAHVARATPTQVRLEGMPHTIFRRSDGSERTTRMFGQRILQPLNELREQAAYEAALTYLRAVVWQHLPQQFVREIAERVKLERVLVQPDGGGE